MRIECDLQEMRWSQPRAVGAWLSVCGLALHVDAVYEIIRKDFPELEVVAYDGDRAVLWLPAAVMRDYPTSLFKRFPEVGQPYSEDESRLPHLMAAVQDITDAPPDILRVGAGS